MIIHWLGLSSFKIKSGEITIVIDPLARSSYGTKQPSGEIDICLLSSGFLNYDKKTLEDCSYVFKNPGEYEVKDVGIQINPSLGPDGMKNNIFSIKWQGLKIVHLGILKQKNSINQVLEKINGTDVLMIPVGGKTVMGATDAVEIVHRIEPSIAVPMFYKDGKTKDVFGLDDAKYFIQEMGQEIEEIDKLKIDKASINRDKTRLMIIRPS